MRFLLAPPKPSDMIMFYRIFNKTELVTFSLSKMSSLFSLRELLQIAIGIMLMAFGVISITIGEFTWTMLMPTIGFFLIGGYLTYRGVRRYLSRHSNVPESTFQPTLQSTQTPSQGGGRFCPNCGSKLAVGSRFCSNCGKEIIDN